MSNVITELDSGSAIAAHIENFVAFWSTYGSASGSDYHDTPEITSFVTGIPYPLFNGVLRANLKPESMHTTIMSVIERLKARRVPAFWWQGPTTAPANLPDALAKHHFLLTGHVPGM